MALITQFDDLPDLFFIDLFNYLSSTDILWAFTNLNNCIQTIINERGFFRHINLSSACLSKFDTLLTILPLNQIQIFIIDIEASPLQLSRWPYLPHLITLRLYGLRDFIDATNFILRHSTSLIHLTLETNDLFMSFNNYSWAYDVWYTLPWAFEQFFDSIEPIQYITKVEVFALPSSYSSIISSSRFRTLSISQNDSLPSIISMPHVVQLNHVNTVHLSFHDWPTGLNLLALRHVTLINNLIALKNFSSFPLNIRSIQILLHANKPNFDSSNWSILRSLSALPMLTSLHIVMNDMNTGLDDISCQIIAETVPIFVHFGICFRRKSGIPKPDSIDHCIEFDPALINLTNDPTVPIIDDEDDDDDEDYDDDEDDKDLTFLESIFDIYRASIKELHSRILCLSSHMKPLIVVEEEEVDRDVEHGLQEEKTVGIDRKPTSIADTNPYSTKNDSETIEISDMSESETEASLVEYLIDYPSLWLNYCCITNVLNVGVLWTSHNADRMDSFNSSMYKPICLFIDHLLQVDGHIFILFEVLR
ncbi:unnamed protein product [Rotaria sordida]|uniref:F-box domain-containing protein n=1 Tax=Rotaria sordida TaxID=392033 RepID=A0A819HPJ9_9BILA|nr:unnamed protein product [Rotaria sordida]